MTKPCIVLDTNVFLVSLAPQYKYHWIYQYILAGKFELCLTTDILLEYEEIVSQRYGIERIDGMFNYLLLLPNISLYTPSFRWYLIENDHDDRNDGPQQVCRLLCNRQCRPFGWKR